MELILRLKDWQLFLIILLLPLILAIGMIIMFDFKSSNYDVTVGIFTTIYYTIFMFWNYRVIKTFNKRELIIKPKQLKRLDWLLIILCIYGIYQMLPIEMRMNGNLLMKILSFFILIISAYAIFFVVFCTAKTLKGIQLKNQERTADVIIEMFVIFYFPIGVWWLQKKVNRFLMGK
jgi:hypothetical protein